MTVIQNLLTLSLFGSVVISGCGGGGTPRNDFIGTYTGGTITGGVNKTPATVTVTVDSQGNFKCTLVEATTPPTNILFTGTVTAATAKTQQFSALETGGPYSGQTVQVFYQKSNAYPLIYPKGFEKVTIFVPPGDTELAWVLAMTSNGTGTTL